MTAKRGEGHIRKLGGKTEYRLIRTNGRQVLEHRHNMEVKLGRRLKRAEIVHHKDGDGLNNDINNLVILTQTEHRKLHGGPRFWKITLEEAIHLREQGATLAEIGKSAGVTWGAIRAVFTHRGISTKDCRHGTTRWNFEQAKELFKQGNSLESIARATGVRAPSIRKAFLKYGVIESS